MSCENIQELMLNGHIDERHLETCDKCKQFLDTVTHLNALEGYSFETSLDFETLYAKATKPSRQKISYALMAKYVVPIAAAIFLVVFLGPLQQTSQVSKPVLLSQAISEEIEGLHSWIDDFEDDLVVSEEVILREMDAISEEMDSFFV